MTEPGIQPSQRKYQFSLRAILIVVTVACLLFAIAARFPRQLAFAALMTGLLLCPLALAAALRVFAVRVGLIGDYWPWHLSAGSRRGIVAWPSGALRFLGLAHTEEGPSLTAGAAFAVVSTLVLVGLWPILREVGLQFAVATNQPEIFTYDTAWDSIRSCFTSRYFFRLWQWELWSVGRWWLLFGGMTAVWMGVSALAMGRRDGYAARLLAFAPWLIVLEMTFLIGVWISSPNTVPEPSTGFVVGIFSWDLWHWDCWLDREWLVRGAVPTLVAGYVFFSRVTRWPRPAAAIGAVVLLPIALLLSVACTVAWDHGLPWPSPTTRYSAMDWQPPGICRKFF